MTRYLLSLHQPDHDRNGLVTDGPYAEGEEHVGGFVVVEAGTRDEALDRARRLSDAATLPVEVRQFDRTRD